MEGNKRQLESDTGDDEAESYDEADRIACRNQACGDLVVAERTGETVDDRKTHEEDSRREHSCQDILDSGLMALIFVLLEGHKGCQRQRGGLESDDEHEEVAGRNHQIHSEERQQNQLVEFAAADAGEFAVGPCHRLDQNDECADIQNVLDCHDGVGGLIHSAEYRSVGSRTGTESENRQRGKEDAGQSSQRP